MRINNIITRGKMLRHLSVSYGESGDSCGYLKGSDCCVCQYLFYLDFLKAPISFGANAINLYQVYILSCVQVNATVTSASQRLTGVF